MYDDAGCSETWVHHHYLVHAWMFPHSTKNAGGIPYFDQAMTCQRTISDDSTRGRAMRLILGTVTYLNIISMVEGILAEDNTIHV